MPTERRTFDLALDIAAGRSDVLPEVEHLRVLADVLQRMHESLRAREHALAAILLSDDQTQFDIPAEALLAVAHNGIGLHPHDNFVRVVITGSVAAAIQPVAAKLM